MIEYILLDMMNILTYCQKWRHKRKEEGPVAG